MDTGASPDFLWFRVGLQAAEQGEGIGSHEEFQQVGLVYQGLRQYVPEELQQPGRYKQKDTGLYQAKQGAAGFVQEMEAG